LRDCQYAIEAGDTIFAPRMKTLLLRAVIIARRRAELAESTRRSYQRRLDRDLNAIMVLAPTNQHGKRLARTEATCSPSWNIPTHHPTTMAVNGNCGRPQHTAR
jgi:transposase